MSPYHQSQMSWIREDGTIDQQKYNEYVASKKGSHRPSTFERRDARRARKEDKE